MPRLCPARSAGRIATWQKTPVLRRPRVRQHAGTPLGYLTGRTERLLFADADGNHALLPEQAEAHRVAALESGKPLEVFHTVDVIATSPTM